MSKKRVFSGIQPSGNLHLGNYLGAIKSWVEGQDTNENIFCIVDEHAITVPQDPEVLKKQTLDLAKIYLAAGIDPKKSEIFVQSMRPEHAELTWILNCNTYVGELARMTQFKDKARGGTFLDTKNISISVGLYDYPVLMAADILLYDTEEVPVGEDQKQHVELTRDIAERFNRKYGDIFTLPAPMIRRESARIMSLQDPAKKMSKSDENDLSRINILDNPDIIRKKLSKAVTDSGNEVKYDKENKPGISNLLNIMSVCTSRTVQELEKEFTGVSYGDFKKAAAEAIIALLEPFQIRYYELNDDYVKKVLTDSAQNIAPRAKKTLERVKNAIGLGI